MSRIVTWGILGTGDIARQMAEDLRIVPHAELRAVASRTLERAEAFAQTHSIPVAYGDYASLAAAPDIDVVYIATPHPRHCGDTLLCLKQKKAVLCEKPLAMNARQVDEMIAAAEASDSFLMEALWTAFFPAIIALRKDIANGVIGEPNLVTANFSYQAATDPAGRLFNPELGGGALLDIGIYTVALADMVYNEEPRSVHAAWTPASTGVDQSEVLILDYGRGRRAVLSASLAQDASQVAHIAGDKGAIHIPRLFSQPDTYTVECDGQSEEHHFERVGYGYHLEAQAVTTCVREGRRACETVPWAMSQRIIKTLDRVRSQWGLHYAAEKTCP